MPLAMHGHGLKTKPCDWSRTVKLLLTRRPPPMRTTRRGRQNKRARGILAGVATYRHVRFQDKARRCCRLYPPEACRAEPLRARPYAGAIPPACGQPARGVGASSASAPATATPDRTSVSAWARRAFRSSRCCRWGLGTFPLYGPAPPSVRPATDCRAAGLRRKQARHGPTTHSRLGPT